MFITKYIPNAITSLNLICGVIGIWFTLAMGDCIIGFNFMLLAMVFDFCDGLAARLLGAYSEVGKELDSLADMVSFGVLPACMMASTYLSLSSKVFWLAWIPVLIAVFSALRLAKFNLDERQHKSFLGLPTPACAIVCGSACCIIALARSAFMQSAWFIPTLSVILCYLLVSNIPMFSFKFSKEDKTDSILKMKRYAFVSISAITIVVLCLSSLPWQALLFGVFTVYIVINLLFALFRI